MKQRPDGVDGKGFEDLKAWQLAHQFMLKVHRLSRKFSPEEKYDLFQQIRRASKSAANNIAEGYGAITTWTACGSITLHVVR